jgi:hypothetical protein
MNMKVNFKFITGAATAAVLLLAAAPARADRRAFTRTYEYSTMPRGGLELEFYNTQSRPKLDEDASAFELQLEAEYGITDHWDMAFYQVIAQDSADGSPLRYTETKLETRYRIGERGDLPVDPLLYLEVAKSLVGSDLELEGKVILARDFGQLTMALNLIGEVVFDGETVFVPGAAFGASFEATPAWKLGAEVYGELQEKQEGATDREVVAWAGPTLSWAPDPKIWVALHAGFGLTDASDDFVGRIVLGLGL